MKDAFLWLLTLSLIAPFSQAQDQAVVSFAKHKNSIVVKATINGKGPYSFVLDTGASLTVISPDVAGKLDVTLTGERVMIMGVGPGSSMGQMCNIKELALGNARARNFQAVIHAIPHLNQSGVVGLLGHDFLERFNLNFNNQKKLLTLSLPTEKPEEKVRELTPLERDLKAVLEDPAAPFQAFNEARQQLTELYQNQELDTFEADLKAVTRDLSQIEKTVTSLYQHLLNGPAPGTTNQQKNKVQKFLYCYTGFTATLQAAQNLARALKTPPKEDLNQAWQAFEQTEQSFERCAR